MNGLPNRVEGQSRVQQATGTIKVVKDSLRCGVDSAEGRKVAAVSKVS